MFNLNTFCKFIIYYILSHLIIFNSHPHNNKYNDGIPPPPSPTILHVYRWIHVNKKNAVSLLRKEPYLEINQIYIRYWLLGNSVGDHIWKWSRYWPFRIHITETQWALGVTWYVGCSYQLFNDSLRVFINRENRCPRPLIYSPTAPTWTRSRGTCQHRKNYLSLYS